jgi:amino acid permease
MSEPVDESGIPQLDASGNPEAPTDISQPDEFDPASPENVTIKRIGRTATFFNLINTLIGAGIVSVPSTFTATGVGPTVLLLVLSCFLCCVAGIIILGLQKDLNCNGINEIAFRVLGKWGMNVVSVCLIIFCFSCTISYLIIGGNQLKSWISLANVDMNGTWKWALIVIIYLCVLPGAMTFPRHLSCLSHMAIPSVLGCVLFVIALIIKGCQLLPKSGYPPKSVSGINLDMGLFTAFGVHALTFNLQIVMGPIIAPYNPSVQKRSRVLGYTFLAAFFIIAIPGLIGYLLFGSETKSDILTSFDDDDVLIIFVRIGLFISVSASYPAIVLSIVGSIGQMIWNESIPETMLTRHRLILIPIVNIVNVVLAVFLPNIKPILGVGGSLGGCLVGFALPSLCRLITREGPLMTVKNIGHIIMFIFGIAAACICTYSSIVDAIAELSKK